MADGGAAPRAARGEANHSVAWVDVDLVPMRVLSMLDLDPDNCCLFSVRPRWWHSHFAITEVLAKFPINSWSAGVHEEIIHMRIL